MTPEEIAALQYDVMTALGQLEPLLPLVERLTDSRQHDGFGFLTPGARKALDAQVKADRRALRGQEDRDTVGLDWLNRDHDIKLSGHVRAPGNVAALSVDADIVFTLRHLVKSTTRRLYLGDRICLVPAAPLPAEPTTLQLIGRMRELVVLVRHEDHLNQVWRELQRLKADAAQLVDGDDRTLLVEPCPYCDRRTLVLLKEDDPDGGRVPHVIRCDRDQHTGAYAPCRCPDPVCECKTKPVAHRHEWIRPTPGVPDKRRKWRDLSNLLAARRAATTKQGAPA